MKLLHIALVVFIFIVSIDFAFSGERNVNINWNENFVSILGYQGEIFEISETGKSLVHKFSSNRSNYIWKTSHNGFFVVNITPLDEKGTPIKEELEQKKIFISNYDEIRDFEPIYVCSNQYEFSWKSSDQKNKYLYRLNDIASNEIISSGHGRADSFSVLTSKLKINNKYHLSVIENDITGHVSQIVNKYYAIHSCRDQIIGKSDNEKGLLSSVFYIPRFSMYSQRGDTSFAIEQMSYISPGIEFENYFSNDSGFGGRGEYYNYLSNGKYPASEELLLSIYYIRKFDESWKIYLGSYYNDFGSFNTELLHNDLVLEDRHKHLYGTIGLSYRFNIFYRYAVMRLNLGMLLYANSRFGDSTVSDKKSYSGYIANFEFSYFFNKYLHLKLGMSAKLLSGYDEFTRYDLYCGPSYDF